MDEELQQAQTPFGRKLDQESFLAGRHYDLDGRPCTFGRWGELVEAKYRGGAGWRIGHTIVGDVTVSTVWLGLDHNFSPHGPPLIFETMVFGANLDQEQWRYSTREQAAEGHAWVVAFVKLDRDAES